MNFEMSWKKDDDIAIPLEVQFDMSVEIDEGTCQGKTSTTHKPC